MTNPFRGYANFPTHLPAPKPKIKNNFCQLLGIELNENKILDNFCSCGNCCSDVTLKEAVCCKDVLQYSHKYSVNWQNFISDHAKCFSMDESIQQIVKNRKELDNFILFDQLRLKEIAKLTKDIYINEYNCKEENEKYRIACYQKITMLVHRASNLRRRVQLPSCIVSLIPKEFPSEEYTGFEESDDE